MLISGDSGLKYKLVCHFKLVADIIGGDVREFVYGVDGSAFLKRKLVGFGVDWYQ
jgi:hypothetical protein